MAKKGSSEVVALRQRALVAQLIACMMRGMSLRAACLELDTDYSYARSLMREPEHIGRFRDALEKAEREVVDEARLQMADMSRLVLERMFEKLDDPKLKAGDLIKLGKAIWDRVGLPAERVVRTGSADVQGMSIAELVEKLPEAVSILAQEASADAEMAELPEEATVDPPPEVIEESPPKVRARARRRPRRRKS